MVPSFLRSMTAWAILEESDLKIISAKLIWTLITVLVCNKSFKFSPIISIYVAIVSKAEKWFHETKT